MQAPPGKRLPLPGLGQACHLLAPRRSARNLNNLGEGEEAGFILGRGMHGLFACSVSV